jgi:PIN domain nuclease of toxin-antitoxin system
LNGYLLDTGVALLAVSTPEALSAGVRKAIEQGPAFLSVVAYWEVTIKSMRGTLEIGDPCQWFSHATEALDLQSLLYRPEHVVALFALPPIHQDPFDRALIAQATSEDLTFLTTDAVIPGYASRGFRVIT